MLPRLTIGCLSAALMLALTGCGKEELGDRSGPPDAIYDVDYVEIFRNTDSFPNIARVCVRGIAFAATSTGRGENAAGAGPIVRVTEWDGFCAGK
ncbi:hypothetical protein IU501_17075 [Nocardia otitidiscaviarum]|uniref:hypothetical protein n=1 Tax=Nocardia otitidiscaviarum TaxID=1823 RepID=UPI0004A75B2C|nr:hypothetical protein [Nocardia otitidiscaviarum]MBF6134710.1 hypothetical protein [Nocardia otitidiscaviarum]MBF6485664.1 hypothetical protein [Nocardia otitidiscaviarum]